MEIPGAAARGGSTEGPFGLVDYAHTSVDMLDSGRCVCADVARANERREQQFTRRERDARGGIVSNAGGVGMRVARDDFAVE